MSLKLLDNLLLSNVKNFDIFIFPNTCNEASNNKNIKTHYNSNSMHKIV